MLVEFRDGSKFLSTPSARRATAARYGYCAASRNFYPRPLRGGRPVVDGDRPRDVSISIPALREEGDHLPVQSMAAPCIFLSTPSARRATTPKNIGSGRPSDFYPRPPRGGRPVLESPLEPAVLISIHALREEGDRYNDGNGLNIVLFLSTPSARRATFFPKIWYNKITISIHALREEGDTDGAGSIQPRQDFYPRPPRGGRPSGSSDTISVELFLSTPSARRATWLLYIVEFAD